jgi:PIN domain nuclease of toxin-antitoxin system
MGKLGTNWGQVLYLKPENYPFYISAISVWEVAKKVSIGKREKISRRVAGLDGVYSLKRLAE